MRTRRTCRAFTLIEVVAAMAIAGVILLALYSAARSAFVAQASGLAALDRSREVSAAVAIVGQDLRATMPPTGILAGAFVGVDGGTSDAEFDTLTLHTCSGIDQINYDGLDHAMRGQMSRARSSVDKPVGGDIRRVAYTLVAGERGSELIRREWANLLAEIEPAPVETVLMRNLQGLSLRYFDGSQWLTTWDSGTLDNALPLAVEVAIRPSGGAAIRLVFRLPSAAPAEEGAVVR